MLRRNRSWRRILHLSTQTCHIQISYRCISISNFDATKVIKSINTKYKHDTSTKQKDALQYALKIFANIESPKNEHSINALLHLLYDWKQPHFINSIWTDIEDYHSTQRHDANKLSFLIQTDSIEIDRCIQALQWMETYNYTLSIHGSLINKLIHKCSKDLVSLQYIHSLMNNKLIQISADDIIVQTVLINAFGAFGQVDMAQQIFTAQIAQNNTDDGLIGAMMKVYVTNNCHSEAISFYEAHKHSKNYILHRLALRQCINSNDFQRGKQLHAELTDMDNIYFKVALIDFYGHFGDLRAAKLIFDGINKNERNIYCVNAMIKAFATNQCMQQALSLLNEHDQLIDDYSYALLIRGCTENKKYQMGKDLIQKNEHLLKSENMNLRAALIGFYGQFNDISAVSKIFASIKSECIDIYCLNAMLSALISNGYYERAFDVYTEFDDAVTDSISHQYAIKACLNTNDSEKGYKILNKLESSPSIECQSKCIEFFGYFGDIPNAFRIFQSIPNTQLDAIAVSAMMIAYIENGEYEQALQLYDTHNSLNDDVSHVLALKATVYSKDYQRGKWIVHKEKLSASKNVQIINSLISFYGNFRQIDSALKVFDSAEENLRDIVTYNAMMDAYRDCKLYHEALDFFNDYPFEYDLVSFIIAIKVCTESTSLHHGQSIHNRMRESKQYQWMLNDVAMQIELIHFYGKCGKMRECEAIFDQIKSAENEKYKKMTNIWNAMICVYGRNGYALKVQHLYDLMMQIGVIPNRETFVQLINAYSHCGDLMEAHKIWTSEIDEGMKYDENVMTALIDGMARNGSLKQAFDILIARDLDCYPMWMSVLSGCKQFNNVQMAESVYTEMVGRFGGDGDVIMTASVLMSNIYVSNGMYSEKTQIMSKVETEGLNVRKSQNSVVSSSDSFSYFTKPFERAMIST